MSSTKERKRGRRTLPDAFYLDMCHAVEEHPQSPNGASNYVSTAQIPTENRAESNALCRVVDTGDGTGISIGRQPIDKSNGYVEPLHWFSVLPPMSLRNAVSKFKDCVELVAESTNLQQLYDVLVVSPSCARVRC